MSRKAQLTSKRRRTARYRFEVADPTAAEQALLEARLAWAWAKDTDGEAAAQGALDAATAAYDECFEHVTLRALPPAQQLAFEQELAELEAADEALRDDAPSASQAERSAWDAASVEVRMIAASDADGRTVDEWAEAFAGDSDWTLTERIDLLAVCFSLNAPRSPYHLGVLGKG